MPGEHDRPVIVVELAREEIRAGEAVVFGAVMDDAGVNNITAGTGFTARQSVNNKDLFSEDLVRGTSGSVAATFTFSAAHRYLAQMVTFKHR